MHIVHTRCVTINEETRILQTLLNNYSWWSYKFAETLRCSEQSPPPAVPAKTQIHDAEQSDFDLFYTADVHLLVAKQRQANILLSNHAVTRRAGMTSV